MLTGSLYALWNRDAKMKVHRDVLIFYQVRRGHFPRDDITVHN